MVGLSGVATWSLAILLLLPANLFARATSLEEAIEIPLENNPDLAAVANELVIARSEQQRANYISQFNPELLSDGDYRYRAGRSNSQEWRGRLSQQLEIFGQPALRRRSAAFGYQSTQANVRDQVRLLTATVKIAYYEAVQQQLRAVELNVEHEVRDAYSRYFAALDGLRASQKDVVGPARGSFALLEDAFKEGKLDLLSLSVAERQAFEAQIGYIEAWFNLASARVSLDLAVGG